MSEETELSEREREILRLVATGASNKEIAHTLVISPNTVKVHLRNIFAKVGVASRTEATLYAIRTGLLPAIAAVVEAPPAPEREILEPEAPAARPEPEAEPEPAAAPAGEEISRPRSRLLYTALALALVALTAVGILFWNNRTRPAVTPTPPAATVLPSRWAGQPALPEAVQDLAGAVYAGQIYITGGENAGKASPQTWRFNPGDSSWSPCADKPTPVSQAGAVLLGEKIYVPGGQGADGSPTRTLEVYDPRADRWGQAAPLPEARSAYALAAYEGQLYLFGGWDGEKVVNTVYAYDPQEDRWEPRSSMPTRRFFMSAAAVSGKILVLGGLDGKALDTLEAYYPSRDLPGETAWETLPPMPQPRLAAGAAVMADMVYLIGGENTDATTEELPSMQYVPATGQWNTLEPPPNPAGSRLLVLPLDTHLHLLGGALPEGTDAQHQAYQAIYNLVFPVIR